LAARESLQGELRLLFNGADDGTRTRNLLITSQLLYQLSYASVLAIRPSTEIPYLKEKHTTVKKFYHQKSECAIYDKWRIHPDRSDLV
jgi:hypothetical protein